MRSGNPPGGFSYFFLLVALTLLAISLLESQDLFATHFQQQQEAQLLFAGNQIREAMNAYRGSDNLPQHGNGLTRDNCFPTRFDQLLIDKRGITPRYHLRQIYLDPFTQKNNWVKVMDSEGRWIGVHSSNKAVPLKKTGFSEQDKDFKQAVTYRDWVFKVEEDPSAPLPEKCQK